MNRTGQRVRLPGFAIHPKGVLGGSIDPRDSGGAVDHA